MFLSTAVALFLITWMSLYLLDYLLRSHSVQAYIDFADRYGLVISPFHLRFYTTRHEDSLIHPAQPSSLFLSLWFNVGTAAGLVAQLGTTFYLSKLFYDDVKLYFESPEADVPITPTVHYEPSQEDLVERPQESGIVPIIPGVNLPISHIPLFMIVLIVVAIIHELGHAWASRYNGVPVNGFGVFIFAIYPGAFTDIDSNALQRASPWQKLQIYSAGVWNNLVLAAFAYLLLVNSWLILSPLFASKAGVMVTNVSPRSGLYGQGGLLPGDVVRAIDDCAVTNSLTWMACIHRRRHEIRGRCIPNKMVEDNRSYKVTVSDDEIHCCSNATLSNLCFESPPLDSDTVAPSLVDVMGGVVLTAKKVEKPTESIFSCVNARVVLERAPCNGTFSCGDGDRCVFPALFNSTRLIKISLAGSTRPVVFVGSFNELSSLVEYSELSPRFGWSPQWLPVLFDLLCKYLLALSLALGLLNALPCVALDGQFVVSTLINHSLRKYFPKRRRNTLVRLLLLYGTAILALNIIVGFFKLYRSRK